MNLILGLLMFGFIVAVALFVLRLAFFLFIFTLGGLIAGITALIGLFRE